MKSFCVTEEEEIISENIVQPVLQVLKDKGAPIKGILFLEVEKGYRLTNFKCQFCFSKIYIFEKENTK